MALVNRPVPGLFGGVSQQGPVMRHPTQCEVQDDCLSTLVDGLGKRPSTYLTGSTTDLTGLEDAASAAGQGFYHTINISDSERYGLVVKNNSIQVINLDTGVVATVSGSLADNYLQTTGAPWEALRAVTAGGTTIIANRQKVPAMKTTQTAANPTNVAAFVINTGVLGAQYRIEVDSFVGTAAPTTDPQPSLIADALRTTLAASAGLALTVTVFDNVVYVSKASAITSTLYYDTQGSSLGASVNNGLDRASRLPVTWSGAADYVVSIRVNVDDADSVYYVKWDGTKKRWVECAAPALTYIPDEVTLPHALVRTALNTFTYSAIVWRNRLVGDNDTNPVPSFIGQPLEDVCFYRNRLGFITALTAVFSRPGDYYNFFAKTGKQSLDTDPVDLDAPAADQFSLAWAVPTQETLILFGDRKQFIVTGGDLFTPSTGRCAEVTSFKCSTRVRPQVLEDGIIFIDDSGSFAQLRKFYLKQSIERQWVADDWTEHTPSYIPTNVRQLAVSSTSKSLALSLADSSRVYVFKYDGNGQELSQKAWQRWALWSTDAATSTHRVTGLALLGDRLYATMAHSFNPASGGRMHQLTTQYGIMRVKQDERVASTSFQIHLDGKRTSTGATYDIGTDRTAVTFNGRFPVLGQRFFLLGGADPEEITARVVSRSITGNVTTVSFQGDYGDASILIGTGYASAYQFTEFLLKDGNGVPMDASKVTLSRMFVRFEESGFANVTVTPRRGQTFTYPFTGRVVGETGPGQAPIVSDVLQVPVGAEPRGCVVRIESASHYPFRVSYAEHQLEATVWSQR